MITFDHVWHTYDSSKKKSKQKSVGGEKAKWGVPADAYWSLEDIDLTIEDGEFVGIAGHTGSGKSTLIQHMNGLVHPSRGRVLVNGKDVADKKNAAEARSTVGLVFQYPENQLFAATVFDDVAFGPRNQGHDEAYLQQAVDEALRQVGLDPEAIGKKSPFELSGGQQRRVAFAGVLAMHPTTLILDEPVAGLDPESREDFLELIEALHRRDNLTVIMVSHCMEDLARLCSRIIMLNKGSVFRNGTPQQVFTDAAELKDIGLGLPAPLALADDLRKRGVTLDDSLYSIDSLADVLAQRYKAENDAR